MSTQGLFFHYLTSQRVDVSVVFRKMERISFKSLALPKIISRKIRPLKVFVQNTR